jgi:phthiodiolone/phenolphthiodiolone dimycocerosates ketoreductase
MAMVRVARALGVRSVWMVDHLTGFFPKSLWTPEFTWMARTSDTPDQFYDWQVLGGHLARRVGRLHLGVAVTEPIRRHPVVLAQAALSLSHMARHPPILGIGSGEAENVVPYGLDFERPVARLEEALQVLRTCLDGPGPHDFEGQFYRLERATLDLRPGAAGAPRIWVGAHGPRMLELAGRYGDGWLPAVPMSPEAYAAGLEQVRSVAVAAGRDPDAVVPAMILPIVIGATATDAERYLDHPAIRFLALLVPDRTWQTYGHTHPLGSGFGGMREFIPDRYSRDELLAAVDAVPSEFLAAAVLAGTAGDIVEQVSRLVEAGLRHVVLSPISPLVSRRALGVTVRALPGIVRGLATGNERAQE